MRSRNSSRRSLLALATGSIFAWDDAGGGILEYLPGVRRRDPRIRTLIYRQAGVIELDSRMISIRPFEVRQAGQPPPPDFAPFLGRALAWAYPTTTIHLDSQPAADVVIRGRIDLFHRIGSQGLRVNISAAVFDVTAGADFLLWNGAKKADWIRRFPADECLLRLADDFVATWSR